MPLRHYLIALFLAAIAGCSLWAWRFQKATESASAVLAFDPTVAEHAAPGLSATPNPAIALADSILNDQAIAALAKQSRASSSADANQIGEFRSGLDLKQPSSGKLMVRFLDSDPGDSAADANAVAQALAAWAPAQTVTPAADANPQPVNPPHVPAETKPAETPSQENHPLPAASLPNHSLSDSLGELSAQLSAADQDIDRLAAESGTGRSANPQAAYTKYRQQQLLKTQVNAAQKKLSDLQNQYGNADAGSDVKGRLATIQQALSSILPGGKPLLHSVDAHGFTAAGTSASQLSRERSQLSNAVSVIDQQRQAIRQTEAAHSASDGSSQAPSPAASAPSASASHSPSSAQPSSSPQQTPAQADSETSASQLPSGHPLSLVRLASPTPQPPLWPAILAGSLCGLFYLGSAALAYRRKENEEDYDEEERVYPQRFITPDEPLYAASEHVEAENPPNVPAEPAGVKTSAREREPAAFITVPKESDGPRRTGFLWDENGEATLGPHEEPPARAGQPGSRTKSVETADPFAEQIRKSLSETEIGRMFERTTPDGAGASTAKNAADRKPS